MRMRRVCVFVLDVCVWLHVVAWYEMMWESLMPWKKKKDEGEEKKKKVSLRNKRRQVRIHHNFFFSLFAIEIVSHEYVIVCLLSWV